jgi:hypothetical protein
MTAGPTVGGLAAASSGALKGRSGVRKIHCGHGRLHYYPRPNAQVLARWGLAHGARRIAALGGSR